MTNGDFAMGSMRLSEIRRLCKAKAWGLVVKPKEITQKTTAKTEGRLVRRTLTGETSNEIKFWYLGKKQGLGF